MTFEDQVVVSDSVPRIFRRLLYWQLKIFIKIKMILPKISPT
jgi:hypothetical protein